MIKTPTDTDPAPPAGGGRPSNPQGLQTVLFQQNFGFCSTNIVCNETIDIASDDGDAPTAARS